MTLPGLKRQELYQALLSAFTREELERVVSFAFDNEKLNSIVSQDSNDKTACFKLIE